MTETVKKKVSEMTEKATSYISENPKTVLYGIGATLLASGLLWFGNRDKKKR